jgi:hypothetical protein
MSFDFRNFASPCLRKRCGRYLSQEFNAHDAMAISGNPLI